MNSLKAISWPTICLIGILLFNAVAADSGQWSRSDLPIEISDDDSMEGSTSTRSERKTGKLSRDEIMFNDPGNASLYLGEAFEKLAESLLLDTKANSSSLNATEPSTENKNETIASAPANFTSGRSAREMDLDALLNGETKHHEPGERESRILNEDDRKPNLSIQGFIPVMSLAASTLASGASLAQQAYRKHSSFVPHYANSEGSLPVRASSMSSNRLGSTLQSLASSITSVGKLKRKQNTIDYASFAQECACVPFYMCKQGYIMQGQQHQLAPNGPVMRMSSMQSQQQSNLNSYLNEAQAELQKLYAGNSLQRNQLAQLFGQPALNPQPHPTASAVLQSALAAQAAAQASQSAISSSNAQPEEIQSQASTNDQSELELPIDERSIDGRDNTHFVKNDTDLEALTRMLGFGSGKAHSCGVLRTCCPILSNHDLNTAQQAMGMIQPPVYSQPQMIPSHQHFQPPIHNYQMLQTPGAPPQMSESQKMKATFYPQTLQLQLPAVSGASLPSQPSPLNAPQAIGGLQQYMKDGIMYTGQLEAQPSIQPAHNFQPDLVRNSAYQEMMAAAVIASLQNNNAQEVAAASGPIYRSSSIQGGRCGHRPDVLNQARISNLNYPASSTEFGEFPWQAALLRTIGPQDSLFVCGATLISNQWVATAAHCIKRNTAEQLKIRLGEWDTLREDEFYPHIERQVAEIIKHPQFYPGTLANDIALLRLETPVPMDQPHIQPACLPYVGENFAGKRCWVAGWGKNAFGQQGDYQSVLKKVDLPVIGHAQCNQALKRTRLGPAFDLHAGFMCAGGEKGKDACEGDGGSGLVCEMAPNVWKVAGLVSWGLGCGKAGLPGVYVNMAYFSNWIERVIASYGRGVHVHSIGHSGSSTTGHSYSQLQPFVPPPQPPPVMIPSMPIPMHPGQIFRPQQMSGGYAFGKSEASSSSFSAGTNTPMDERSVDADQNQLFEPATLINERSNSNSTSDELVLPLSSSETTTEATSENSSQNVTVSS